MAIRKALVLNNGQIQQLQSGDSLGINAETIQQTNDESVAVVIGTAVYNDANDGVKRAQANALSTSKVLGLVSDVSIANGAQGSVQVDGILTATTAQWDAVAGTTGGLTFGTDYFLDPANVGKITATAPSTQGQCVTKIGRAMSTTELRLMIGNPILL